MWYIKSMNIVLVEPEIPQNAGNVARTCACIGADLHMVEPFGFRMSDKYFARSGCDYWDKVNLIRWPSLEKFLEANASKDLWFFTGRVEKSFHDAKFSEDSWLIFGRETAGLPPKLITEYKDRCVRIPMRENLRSLNLANSVAIGAYEALRQSNYPHLI